LATSTARSSRLALPDEEAQKAAEEVAGFESQLAGIESKVSVLRWMVGFNLALSVAIAITLSMP
jgi:hypothetical protein